MHECLGDPPVRGGCIQQAPHYLAAAKAPAGCREHDEMQAIARGQECLREVTRVEQRENVQVDPLGAGLHDPESGQEHLPF